ncbi:MAG: mevalonate kinase [Anaerolineales bacterium]|nr:mevalonate kinase [Anaerolineales bacterium]
MTTASASGKIILFGEHAVVYNRPALAVPIMQVHADVEILDSSRAGIWINAPDVNLHAEVNTLPSDHPIASVINKFASLSSPHFRGLKMGGQRGVEINITSTIPVASGLGSGAAVSVALIRALSSHLKHSMPDKEVNAFAYEIEKLYHGTPSGIDNTVITYAKPVYFMAGEPTETFKVGAPFTIVIGDTGIPAPTKESVADVRKLWRRNQVHWESIFDEIGQIALMARRAIEGGRPEMLGELMDQNHVFLQELTVSSPELDKLVDAARKAGALGAKMSGGGRGGNMIALVTPDLAETVTGSMQEAGAKHIIVTKIE